MLEALGAPVSEPGGVPEALLLRRRRLWERLIEPVVVAWGGQLGSLTVGLPTRAASGRLSCRIEVEGAGVETFTADLDGGVVERTEKVDGVEFVALSLRAGRTLPLGYHRLAVRAGRRRAEALVISAPKHAYAGPPDGAESGGRPPLGSAFGAESGGRAPRPSGSPPRGSAFGGESGGRAPRPGRAPRLWGAFAPLYAVHSEHSLGIGDFTDLRALQQWVGGQGGDFVATLPLLACFVDRPFEPSPYSPVSRLFWNEIFIDLAAVPEVRASPAAREALATEYRLARSGLRDSPLIDYRPAAAAKRRVLQAAAEALLAGGSSRRDELERFAADHPGLDDYAAFRAACEHWGGPWQAWPEGERDSAPHGFAAPPAARAYHRYVQWIAAGQISSARRAGGAGLVLDLPLGVHPGGYDTWRYREAFVTGASAGAPPDAFHLKGQDWGNPPLHPEGIRGTGYAYPIACVRHLLGQAQVLRIDHVMSLHRLFVLPPGGDARDGVYIRYRPDEGYAIFCLESQRAAALIVGEDLGTVPAYVRREMATHRIHRTYVALFGIEAGLPGGLERPPADCFASINTHDMAPFAGFWQGIDIQERRALGLLTGEQARSEAATRQSQRQRLVAALVAEGLLASDSPGEPEVLEAWLAWLARSDARCVLVALEDLWGETASQNVPGTVAEHPNWRHRAAVPLEAIRSMPEVVGRLKMLGALRTRA